MDLEDAKILVQNVVGVDVIQQDVDVENVEVFDGKVVRNYFYKL